MKVNEGLVSFTHWGEALDLLHVATDVWTGTNAVRATKTEQVEFACERLLRILHGNVGRRHQGDSNRCRPAAN